jgi:hypothetical protein
LRHTKLTDVAKKHPDQILKKFGNWKKGTEMMEVYVHLSESDLEEAVLKEHGLLTEGEIKKGLTLRACPGAAKTTLQQKDASNAATYLTRGWQSKWHTGSRARLKVCQEP